MKRAETKRASLLLRTLHDAKEWRETFEEQTEASHAIVVFADCYMTADERGDDRSMHGFSGNLEMPRDIALSAMRWIEEAALAALHDLGVGIEHEDKSA